LSAWTLLGLESLGAAITVAAYMVDDILSVQP
jgi:hypothetical protein